MISYKSGNIFTSELQVLVNPVNTVGIMGKGLAKHFKTRYPVMYDNYKIVCDNHSLKIGNLHLFRAEDKWILNFPTKAHWRGKSKVEYIEAGLKHFVSIYKDESIESTAFPMLGCGLGGLDWDFQVKPLMEYYLTDLGIPIEIYVNL